MPAAQWPPSPGPWSGGDARTVKNHLQALKRWPQVRALPGAGAGGLGPRRRRNPTGPKRTTRLQSSSRNGKVNSSGAGHDGFFNYATMQMAAKIVYYGPGLCGKTTNLQAIHHKIAPQSRGEMVSLETETDRTLFFDLLPLDVGVIGGFKTRVQLYTVPGQVFYGETRRMVLRGVDGVVFVADSQRPMREANIESMKDLEKNLQEMNLLIKNIPLVLQYNKRDLTNLPSKEELDQDLNWHGWSRVESSAVNGMGVFDTLKSISRLTLGSLKHKLSRPEPVMAPPGPPRSYRFQAPRSPRPSLRHLRLRCRVCPLLLPRWP